jgi:hypothetical protein
MKNWKKAIASMTTTEQGKLSKAVSKSKKAAIDIITDTECYLVDKELVKGYLQRCVL